MARPSHDDEASGALLSLRSALVLLLALMAGGAAAALTVLAGHTGWEAALAGLGACMGGVKFFDWLIA